MYCYVSVPLYCMKCPVSGSGSAAQYYKEFKKWYDYTPPPPCLLWLDMAHGVLKVNEKILDMVQRNGWGQSMMSLVT